MIVKNYLKTNIKMKKKRKDKDLIESFKAVKTTFKSILKNNEDSCKIYDFTKDAMIRTNKIVIFTYQFIKLYIIDCYENNRQLPVINSKFIKDIMDVLTTKTTKGPKKNMEGKENLYDFYENHFKIKKVSKIGLSQILNYTATSMETAYTNTIIGLFKKSLSKYIYCMLKEKYAYQSVKSRKKQTELRDIIKKELKETINLILNNENNDLVHFLPTKPTKENHLYHITVKPFDYLKPMIFMNRKLEDIGVKNYSFLPLRSNIVPKYIDIDTKVLIELSDIEGKGKLLKDINGNKFYVWDKFFNMNHSFFSKNKYDFKYHIQTDLVGVSAIFSRFIKEQCSTEGIKYITDISNTDLKKLKDEYNFVYCDPGKRQLLYMMDDNSNFFRYTIQQRRKELKISKYTNILQAFENSNNITTLLQPLSSVNSKSFHFNEFKSYVIEKNKVNEKVSSFYIDNILYRKLNFRKYTLKQKSEEKLLNNIKTTFTKDNKQPLVIYGNWSITKQQANFVPTPNVHIRKMVSKKFKMLLIDEFRTSCLSYRTHNEIVNMKDKVNGKKIHQVLILTENNKNIGCINRDKNAVNNFKTLTDYYIESGLRHDKFQRGKPRS